MHAWVDLNDGKLSPYPGSVGVKAIATLLRGEEPVATPEQLAQEDYYSMSLLMLARLAHKEGAP
ncbi:hypothetical protein ACFSVK_19780 [Azorhizophilus paspali]|uniref:hypothetical protein n=1 Tax=Azorhizophilus paspali TaxID=69963 RepID=UPI00362F6157